MKPLLTATKSRLVMLLFLAGAMFYAFLGIAQAWRETRRQLARCRARRF